MTAATFEQCSALAFYGFRRTKGSISELYQAMSRCFQDLGCPVDKVSIHGPGHDRRWQAFKAATARLQTTGFESITDLSMVALIPGGRTPLEDYFVSAHASTSDALCNIVCKCSVASLMRDAMMPIAKEIIQIVKPRYGIGYVRPHHLGPGMYAIGIVQGLGPDGYGIPGEMTAAEEAEANSISHWGSGIVAGVWERGLLRDVYPWNFLIKPQLDARVGGMTLREWIEQDEKRGKLDALADGIWFWELEATLIQRVREALDKADIIFDWNKHVLGGKARP